MKNHTELLNYLATTFNLQSYLEIGLGDGKNFKNVKLLNSEVKFGIDPAVKETHCLFDVTSDEFFYSCDEWHKYFDLIFIDGLHHADQVKRDFDNSLRCLSANGFIVIHDTYPEKEEYTHVPRDSKIWNGDVYKFACSLPTYKGIDFCTWTEDHGCTIVWKDENCHGNKNVKPVNDWNDFMKRKHLLRPVNEEDLKTRIEYLLQNIKQLS